MAYDNNNPKLWFPLFLVGIGLNIGILWYLLITFPSECARIGAQSHGQVTCGLNAGAYLIAGASIVVLVLLVTLFIRWNFAELSKSSS